MSGGKLSLLFVIGLALLLVGAPLAAAQTNDRPDLRFDPFRKPDLAAMATAGYAPVKNDKEWGPTLTATLVAGERSLANLGGVVLGLGEESHGYRLLEVRAWEAVFEHGGERSVLTVTAPNGDR